jgi:ComF family protein
MKKIFRTGIWLPLIDILFPERCLSCGAGLNVRHEVSYCPACLLTVRFIRAPFCKQCGIPFSKAAGSSHLCGDCLRRGWHFIKARAAVGYQPPVTEAVKAFKYNGKMYGVATFTALANQFLQLHPIEEPDLIIPVPLHPKRLRQRGFNQALMMAKKIFPEYRDRINPHVLERHLWTRPQTGLKGAERLRNVKNVFRVSRPEKIYNQKILLVDDVFTTGATVNECARVLVKNMAAEVDVFTFARVTD